MSEFKIDFRDLEKFLKNISDASKGKFKQRLMEYIEALGFEFLDIIVDEIIRKQSVDTRKLLNSFTKGDGENVWKITNGGLTLEVGTNVEYADYVNTGHHTTPEGVEKRWVGGRWRGSKFEYDPSANTGMLLKRKWIEGSHYYDDAVKTFREMFNKSLDRKLQQWLDEDIGRI